MNEWRQWWWRWLKECVLSAPSIIHPTNTLIGDCDSPTSSVSSLFCLSRVFFSCQPNWSSLSNTALLLGVLTHCSLCNFCLILANSHTTILPPFLVGLLSTSNFDLLVRRARTNLCSPHSFKMRLDHVQVSSRTIIPLLDHLGAEDV